MFLKIHSFQGEDEPVDREPVSELLADDTNTNSDHIVVRKGMICLNPNWLQRSGGKTERTSC